MFTVTLNNLTLTIKHNNKTKNYTCASRDTAVETYLYIAARLDAAGKLSDSSSIEA
jgi:hypothetical protein